MTNYKKELAGMLIGMTNKKVSLAKFKKACKMWGVTDTLATKYCYDYLMAYPKDIRVTDEELAGLLEFSIRVFKKEKIHDEDSEVAYEACEFLGILFVLWEDGYEEAVRSILKRAQEIGDDYVLVDDSLLSEFIYDHDLVVY